MFQQQIVDYAKAQFELGIAKDVVRSSLVSVGWDEADVDDSLKGLNSPPPTSRSSPPKTEEKKLQTFSRSPTIMISDLAGDSKIQLMAKSIDSTGKEESRGVAGLKHEGAAKPKGTAVLVGTLLITALGAAGGAGYLYLQNKGLQDKAGSISNDLAAANSKITALNSQIKDLSSMAGSLADSNKELSSELSFFVVSAGASSSGDLDFSLRGTLAGGARALYTLTSDNGIPVSIKNSKNPKADAVLKNLVGKKIEIGGTHLPGSRDVSVTYINGNPIK